ncbi:hypothetical protein D9757_004542 [Collybiopsis confluens]|uniref:Uncharacterized protein n=1 Tax=Collybiopsis confluens TaxID=2823264 RepID=A0A8H5MEC1_9AGAR|nr:hypothetical protein D9757_004542 [Collybiopsis confluens]
MMAKPSILTRKISTMVISVPQIYTSNPRALEHLFYPVYEVAMRDLLRPVSLADGHRFVVAGQQHLWRSKEFEKSEDARADEDTDSEEELEGEDEVAFEVEKQVPVIGEGDVSDSDGTDELDEDSAGQVSGTEEPDTSEEESDPEADAKSIYSATHSTGTVQGVLHNHVGKIPDGIVYSVSVQQMVAPPNLAPPLDDCGDHDEKRLFRRAYCDYVHSGGQFVEDFTPTCITELKRAPRRYLAKRKLDSEAAFGDFYRETTTRIDDAMDDMATYSAVFFKKYPDASRFLAIVGSGPFWKSAIILRENCPWDEPNRPRQSRQNATLLKNFQTLFGTNIFEIGTVRSDEKWNEIRRSYFMGEGNL